jgi:hypothetical protein
MIREGQWLKQQLPFYFFKDYSRDTGMPGLECL